MENRVYKVTIIGFCHMHINSVAGFFYEHPNTQIVAAADTTPYVKELNPDGMFARNWNKKHCEEKFRIPKIYDNYLEMLDAEKPDLAVICCENALHAQVVEECGKRGVDCCVEKPMATSLSDALSMVRAMNGYGMKMLINWGMPFNPSTQKMKEVYESGAAGKLIEFRCRIGNMGPLGKGSKHPGIEAKGTGLTEAERGSTWWHQRAAGGGAMADFCAYGCLLSYWFNGKSAVSAYGMRGNFEVQAGNADDESVIVARYPESIAICEGTWTSQFHPELGISGPVLHCANGDIWQSTENGQPVVKVRRYEEDDVQVFTTEPSPEQLKGIASSYVYLKETGKYASELQDPVFNLGGVALLDAGIRSADTGKSEIVNDVFWQIG